MSLFGTNTSRLISGAALIAYLSQLTRLGSKLMILVVVIGLTTGCVSKVSPKADSEFKTNIPLSEIVPDNKFYLDTGDQLSIKFYYNSELNEDLVVVLPDGTISLQLVGTIAAKGKTVDQLTNNLKERYSKIITRTEIAVLVRSLRERSVFVGGEVRNPGQYVDRNGLNPLQATFLAGGFKNTAELGSILILRRTTDAKFSYYIYDLKESLSNLESFDSFRLRDSDIIYVSKSNIGNVNEFIDLYVSGILPSWFDVFVNYEIDKIDPN